jgi:hypothetical protein
VAQVVKGLPSKCEALSSNPNTTKGKKKKKNLFPLPAQCHCSWIPTWF